jgi:predicted Fe-Mo cluster-binding NifX family protein
MKVAIPVNERSMETNISQSFGRTPYFLIYDTETQDSIFIDNAAAVSQGGAGIKAAQAVVDSKADALITPRCGQNAAYVIKAANICIYKSLCDSIQENIQSLNHGKLPILKEIHEGFHGRGGR